MLLVGYKSKKSFYSHFRAYTGRTPGCFRRRL
jgi:AraC-like DNA-binding protein